MWVQPIWIAWDYGQVVVSSLMGVGEEHVSLSLELLPTYFLFHALFSASVLWNSTIALSTLQCKASLKKLHTVKYITHYRADQ